MSASILVVDDEPDVAELFRQRLRRETRQARMSCITPPDGRKHRIELAGENRAHGDHERRQATEYSAAESLTKPLDFGRLKAQLYQLPSAPD
jgi:CheY-like chemotaxis protein